MRLTLVAVLAAGLALPYAAQAQSCRAELGARRAQVLVDRCIEISPATHPPCNADNACSLIRSEIVRGCNIADADKPTWCGDYTDN